MQEVEIARWSGIWRHGAEVRVGVRLVDGRDALLVAFAGHEGEHHVHYTLLIQGVDHNSVFVIPSELEKKINEKLFRNQRVIGSRSLKDLKLF